MVTILIGISTFSSITSVIPQYPVWGLLLPLAKFGVILHFALNYLTMYLIIVMLNKHIFSYIKNNEIIFEKKNIAGNQHVQKRRKITWENTYNTYTKIYKNIQQIQK